MHPTMRATRTRGSAKWVGRTGAMVGVLIVLGCGSDPESPQPPRIDPIYVGPEGLIRKLVAVYQQRDYAAFANLFPNATDPVPIDPIWAEGRRIHRRMFEPESPLPGETPVPQELWLRSISITLKQLGIFTERPDLYRSLLNPDGLDANVWKAMDCMYHANLFFDTQGPTDYQVDCLVDFVVIENLAKGRDEDRKFLIFRWEELAAQGGCSWSAVMSLYAS